MPIGGSKRRLFQARSFKLDDHEHHAQADAYWRMVLKDLQRGHKREIAKQVGLSGVFIKCRSKSQAHIFVVFPPLTFCFALVVLYRSNITQIDLCVA
jgi:hypothetical protein